MAPGNGIPGGCWCVKEGKSRKNFAPGPCTLFYASPVVVVDGNGEIVGYCGSSVIHSPVQCRRGMHKCTLAANLLCKEGRQRRSGRRCRRNSERRRHRDDDKWQRRGEGRDKI